MNNFWPLLWKQARRSEATVEREAPAPVARLSDRSTQISLSFLQHPLGDFTRVISPCAYGTARSGNPRRDIRRGSPW